MATFWTTLIPFESLLGPSRWTDRKADSHSLTIRTYCCLPPSKAGLGGRRLGDGKGWYEVSAGISEGGCHKP